MEKQLYLHHWVQAGCKFLDTKISQLFSFLGTIKEEALRQSKKRQNSKDNVLFWMKRATFANSEFTPLSVSL